MSLPLLSLVHGETFARTVHQTTTLKDTYRNDTLFKHASQMSASPLKSNVQHLLTKNSGKG